mgnify:CR=1 FL=1
MKYQYDSENIKYILNLLNEIEVKGINNSSILIQIFNIINNPVEVIESKEENDESE